MATAASHDNSVTSETRNSCLKKHTSFSNGTFYCWPRIVLRVIIYFFTGIFSIILVTFLNNSLTRSTETHFLSPPPHISPYKGYIEYVFLRGKGERRSMIWGRSFFFKPSALGVAVLSQHTVEVSIETMAPLTLMLIVHWLPWRQNFLLRLDFASLTSFRDRRPNPSLARGYWEHSLFPN